MIVERFVSQPRFITTRRPGCAQCREMTLDALIAVILQSATPRPRNIAQLGEGCVEQAASGRA